MNTQLSDVGTRVAILLLGQSGCRIDLAGKRLYCDPYLSNSVAELDGPDLQRLISIPFAPQQVDDADCVLITHSHIDHCDPQTLPALAVASPRSQFIGPRPVLEHLRAWGIAEDRLQLANEYWTNLSSGLRVHAVPAAHPAIVRDEDGNLECVGYMLEAHGQRVYVAGDTSVSDELLDALRALRPITLALLPVNERNYFRTRRGIVGNMSVREAFQLAAEIGISSVVPVHWDMFAANRVQPDEMLAVYRELQPSFELLLGKNELWL